MDNLIWRLRAKVIAYVDIVLLCLNLLMVILMVFVFAGVTVEGAAAVNDPSTINQLNSNGVSQEQAKAWFYGMAWILWVLVAVTALMTAIQMWAAFKLLSAAEMGREPSEALAQARIWRNVTIVFFVLSIIGCLGLSIWALVITIIWRGTGLFIVFNFMKELEFITTSQSGGINSFPVGVVISK